MNDVTEGLDYLDSQRQAGLGQAVTSVDDDPEAAARAIQIGKASGIPPIVVHDDLEGYEAQHKAALTHDILRNNPYLQAYAAHDPMAAKVSSDDWGQLDTIHQSLDKLGPISVGQKMAEGFVSGVGPGGIGSWIKPEDVEKYPLGSIGYAILGAPVEVPLRLIGGIMEAGARGAGEMYSQVTGDREGGRRIGEDLLRVVNDPFWIAMMHSMGTGGAEAAKGQTAAKAFEVSRPYLEAGKEPPTGLHPLIDQMKQKQSELELKALQDLTKEAQKSTTRERAPEMFEKVIELKNQGVIGISADAVARLYGDKLPKPDDNVLGWIPDLEKQMYLALSSGGDIEVPIAKWATYVDPEIAKQLHDDIRPRKGGVTKAEGEILTEQAKQRERPATTKAENYILTDPLGAKVDGEELSVRVIRNKEGEIEALLSDTGVTKVAPAHKSLSPEEAIAHTLGDHPMGAAPDITKVRKAEGEVLKQQFAEGEETPGPAQAFRDVYEQIKQEQGGIGTVYIGDIIERTGLPKEVVHEALMESQRRGELTLHGSSAAWVKRTKAQQEGAFSDAVGGADDTRTSTVVFKDKNEQAVTNVRTAAKLDPLFEEAILDKRQAEADLDNSGAEKIQVGDVEVWLREHIKGKDGEIVEAIEQEGKKLGLKGVDVGAADKIVHQGEEVRGTYTQFTEHTPLIFYALTSDDPKGYFRHEAMHHLRQMGFFKEGEWDTLVAKAMDEDWIKKHDIDERYPTLDKEGKFEEAIAEEFRNRTGEYEAAGRLRKFLDAIKAAIKRILGYEPDANELFRQVEQGKIGERTGVKPLDPTSFDQKLAKDEFEEMQANVANDKDAFQKETPSYDAAVTGQRIKQLVDKDSDVRDHDAWQKIADEEGHKIRPTNTFNNAYAAARAYSRDGKTTMLIRADGSRIVYQDGVKVAREPFAAPKTKAAKGPGQGELDVTRQEDKKLFATIAGWMNKAQQAKYMDLIAKRNAEDADFQLKKAERLERKRQSEEWKQNEAELRPEVEKDVRDRPDMQALEFFRTGRLWGHETGTRPRVDPSKLTPGQRGVFPEKYQRRDGMDPQEAANLFGYTSFDGLMEKIAQRDTELGSKTTAQFMKGIVDKELEQRMLAEYGDKEENILREAQEHVISPTQMDLLHEETVALGMKIGSEMTFTKADFKAWVQDKFKDAKAASISVENFLRDAGKVGREVEAALLEDKPTDAFKGKQRQLMSLMLADEAIKFEKDQGRLEKLAKRFSSREVAGVLPEYTNFVHDILQRIGEPVRRSVQDLAEAIGNSGFKDISHFVDSKEADLREVPVADFLLDPNFRKPLKDMTVDEYRAVLKSIQALVHNGRNELKIIREGEEADLQSVKDGMREQLEAFPEKHIDVTGKPKQGFKHAMRTAWASLLQIEALFNRWDRGDRNGLFTKYISLPLADASNNFASLERKYGAKLRELKDKVDLSEGVDNTIFREPTAGGFGELMQFNRGNLRAILRYAGRPQAFEKLAKGYGLDPAQITDWLNQHATKEDWDWASKQGKIFDEVFEEASKMYTRLTGVAPEKSEVAPVQTPFGTYDGWYHPIDYDSRFPGPSKKLMGGDSLEQKNYVRATTPAGYTKKVTGYNAPLSLDIANTAEHMRGMLHDIAYREAVIEASKIFYDHSFQRTVNKHYGLEYQKLLVPYLRDVANLANFRSDAQATGAHVSEFLRQNIIGTLIGFNPGTVLKHGATAWINSMNEVGSLRFLEAVKDMFQRDEVTGDRNWSFALEHSEELQRRHRNYIDTMRGGEGEALGETSWRETMLRGGAWTVSKADLASAVPTWLAEYRHSMEEGSSHGEAISDGNRAVRRAHGSSVITNRPAAMRGGQAAQWMTSLYGFFSHMLNKQFEMMWRARETLGKFSEGEYQEAAKDLPQLSSMFFSYVIFPALIEELVTPLTNDEHESWAAWTGKTLAKGVSSSWPIIRDVAHAALSLHNTEPSVGLFTSSLKTAIDVTRDMKDTKRSFSKERAGKTLQHGITAFGALTGLTNQQEGRVANFMYNMSTGQEKPKGPWQFAVGMRFGQTKGHSKSFDDYMKSLVGNRR